jgi:AcrR family transcriptional regulator
MSAHLFKPNQASTKRSARQRIVAAARHHFLAHGFRGVTMDDLAQELGMSKKTLYTYFDSKTELVRAMLLDKFDCAEADVARLAAQACSNFQAALHDVLVCVQSHTEEIRPPFVRDLQREMPELFRVVEERRRGLIQRHFGKLLGEGRKAGMIRKDIQLELMIDILLGTVQAIMNPPKMAELGLTPTSGFSAIITVILEGVLTPKGRAHP